MCGETRDFSLAAFGVREAAEAVSRSAPPPSPRRRIVQRCKDTCHAFPPALQRQFTQRIQDHHRPEELGLPYALHHVRIDHGEQRRPEFLRLNPHGRIPVLVDRPPASPCSSRRRSCSTWRRPAGGCFPTPPGTLGGPDLADFPCFQHGPHPRPARAFRDLRRRAVPAGHRTLSAALRGGFATLDQRLAGRPWLAGEQYSIADIATFGWTHTARIVDFDFSHYRHLDDWHRRMALRLRCSAGSSCRNRRWVHERPAAGASAPAFVGTLAIGACSPQTR